MDFDKYIQDQLTKIQKTYKRYEDAYKKISSSASAEYQIIAGFQVKLSPEAIEKNQENAREFVGQLKEEYKESIQEIVTETEQKLADEKKKAIQAYTAAEPVPTDEQLRRVEQIKQEYTVSGVFNRMLFNENFNYHIENETVNAYPYYLIALEVARNAGDHAEERRLNDILMQLFPDVAAAADNVKAIEDATKYFRMGVILFEFDTDETLKTPERTIDSIRMKEELYSLGYYSENGVPSSLF